MTIVRAKVNRPGMAPDLDQPLFQDQGYTANGVHFAGSIQGNGPTFLVNNALRTTQPDNGTYCFSFWAQNLMTDNNDGCTLWVHDPGSATIGSSVVAVGGAYNPSVETNVQSSNTVFEWFSTPANLSSSFDLSWSAFPFPNSDSNWHHYLGSIFTFFPQGLKVGILYIDDIPVVFHATSDFGNAFVSPVSGKKFVFGDDIINLAFFPSENGFGPDMNVADVWISPNQSMLRVAADGSISIPETIRRAFTSRRKGGGFLQPGNPQNFPSAPIIFTGPASTFGANLGTGGQFTLQGTLGDVQGPGQIPVP